MAGTTDKMGLQDETITLLANTPFKLPTQGNYVLIHEAGEEITVTSDSGRSMRRGMGCGFPMNYTQLMITSPVNQTVRISLGFCDNPTPIEGVIAVVGNVTATDKLPTAASGLQDLTIAAGNTGTIPANTARDSLLITLDDAAPDYVRVASGAADRGARLYPGGSLVLRGPFAVVIRNPNGVAVTVSATEVLA